MSIGISFWGSSIDKALLPEGKGVLLMPDTDVFSLSWLSELFNLTS